MAAARNVSEDILQRLGSCVLIPIPRGVKAPAEQAWQLRTATDMADPDYIARLNNGSNVGVVLGKPSDGLCTVDIDDDQLADQFLKINPHLQATLVTKRVRGCNLWLRIEGEYPASTKLATTSGAAFGEWRADGNQTLIHGEVLDSAKGETEPTPYRRIGGGEHPITITFDAIEWPEKLSLPWRSRISEQALTELIERYGRPLIGGKILHPNEWFWAGLYSEENHILFEPEEAEFYHYNENSGLWRPKTKAKLAHELADRLLAASRELRFRPLESKRGTAVARRIMDALQGIVEQLGVFEETQRIVHCANGVLRIEGDGGFDLCEFAPTFYSRNQSPISFDENASCPRFLEELLHAAVPKDDVVLIQKYAGLCLLGDNLIQRILILDGMPGRGKTQLALIFQKLIGQINCCELRTEQLGERFEIGRFRKKTLLVGVDVPGTFLMQRWATKLKGLVGGDLMSGELKNNNSADLSVRGNKCVIITSNSRLRVRLEGDVGAWRRRLLIIRYEAPPPERKIADFADVLIREEGSGILRWALEGLEMLLNDVAETGADIVLTDAQSHRVDALLAESDSLRHFLEERVEPSEDSGLSTDELHFAYGDYCAEKHWNTLSMTAVSRQLPDLMLEQFEVVKTNKLERDGHNVRGYTGVVLK
jgi:phage/plasmid-associated DNA primase